MIKLQHFKKSAVALALLGGFAGQALAAASVNLEVTGTITPVACAVSLGGGGVIDYGVIPPDSLSATDYTTLEVKDTPFQITCDSPVQVGVTAKTLRPGSVAGGTEWGNGLAAAPVSLFGGANMSAAGLGLNGTEKIGGYAIAFPRTGVTLDGAPADTIYKSNTGPWKASLSGAIFATSEERTYTWANPGTLVPEPFAVMGGTLSVQAYINKKSELTVTAPIRLDGMASIELVYL